MQFVYKFESTQTEGNGIVAGEYASESFRLQLKPPVLEIQILQEKTLYEDSRIWRLLRLPTDSVQRVCSTANGLLDWPLPI